MSFRTYRICCLTVAPNDLVDEEIMSNVLFIEADPDVPKRLLLWYKDLEDDENRGG